MSDNLSDIIVVSVIWISAAVVCIVLKDAKPFGLAIVGTGLYMFLSR